jgi:hypothetical protein
VHIVYKEEVLFQRMLFKPCLVEPILNGTKTETRRLWKRCLVKTGNNYQAKTNFRNDSEFATIKIAYVRRERLGSIRSEGLKKEGCRSLNEFKRIWIDSYGSWQPNTHVFVIGFKLV